MTRITLRLLTLVVVTACGFAAPAAAGTGTDPEKDPQMMQLLQEARRLIDGREPAAAIAKCDAVIRAYEEHYSGSKQRIFCGRTPEERLGEMLKAAVDKSNALALSSTWAEAGFMKAYALQDLGRLDEAKATLQQALKLSPFNAQYLAELGGLHSHEKNWVRAEQLYRDAEDNASLSPPSARAEDLARARRGLGYVFVELGRLDEAEKKYEQCLATNPDDTKAKAELQYVRAQKAKRNAQH